MKEIKLTQGKIALVDDEDFEHINQFKWFAVKRTNNDLFTAVTNIISKSGKQTSISMHRLIMDFPKGKEVDHIDRNPLNNQKANLRISTRSQNSRNRRCHKNNKLGTKGVYFDKYHNRFRAEISFQCKKYRLGYFQTIEEAVKAYNTAAKQLHGEYASLSKF